MAVDSDRGQLERVEGCKLALRWSVQCVRCLFKRTFGLATKYEVEARLIELGWAARGCGRWDDAWLCDSCVETRHRWGS